MSYAGALRIGGGKQKVTSSNGTFQNYSKSCQNPQGNDVVFRPQPANV